MQFQSFLWGADYPLAANFYGGMVTCPSDGGFCDRTLDARAAAAARLQAVDPGAATRAWTAIDRAVTDEAVTVPGVSWADWRFVSRRVGNYQNNEILGTVLSQLWVR